MKKGGMIAAILITFIPIYVFSNKLYYPPLPIEGTSTKEALHTLEESDSPLVKLAQEDNFTWYISRSEKGISFVDENVKQMLAPDGWEFKQKEGSGLFFEKEGQRLIATTEMWTKRYVLISIPIY